MRLQVATLSWFNQELSPTENKENLSKVLQLSLLGFKYPHLPYNVLQALKDPNSLISKELNTTKIYFYSREEMKRVEAQNLFMQLYLAELKDENEYLLLLLEKSVTNLHRLLELPQSPEAQAAFTEEINEKEDLMAQLRKTMNELATLMESKTKKLKLLEEATGKLNEQIVKRSEGIVRYIDYSYEELDKIAMNSIAEEKDPWKRAQLYLELRSIQEERKVAKERAKKVPEVLEKSGLIVSPKDQALRGAMNSEMRLVTAKNERPFKLDKDGFNRVLDKVQENVRVEDKKVDEEKFAVRKIKREIAKDEHQIEEKTKELVELQTKLDLPVDSLPPELRQVNQMDVETFTQKAQGIQEEIDKFIFSHQRHILAVDEAISIIRRWR